MWLAAWLNEPWCGRLALTLLHFLWQGALVAVVASLVAGVFAARSAANRYSVYLVAMAALLVCPLVTFFLLGSPQLSSATDATLPPIPVTVEQPSEPLWEESRAASAELAHHEAVVTETSQGVTTATTRAAKAGAGKTDFITGPVHVWLVRAWLTGVLVMLVRLVLGVFGTRRLLVERLTLPAGLAERAAQLCRRFGVAEDRLAASQRVREAVTCGFLRPVVLLPVSWLAKLTPEVLEAIIAHELAHVRRWHQWGMLLQRVVESLLFYHPAVWWLSARVQTEREWCCDNLAVAATDRLTYARMLEQLGRTHVAWRRPLLVCGIGGSKMKLLDRVRNVLGVDSKSRSFAWWPLGVLVVAIAAGAWFGGPMLAPTLIADDERREDEPRGDRERGERERERREGDRPREGDRERGDGERREGDRPREGDRREDGERRDAPREGERRERDVPREGDRRGDGERRDVPREGERRDAPREGDRRDVPREGERRDVPRREGDHPDHFGPDRRHGDFHREGFTPREAELLRLIRQLQEQVEILRREVQQLRGGDRFHDREVDRVRREGERRDVPRDGDFRHETRREGDRDVPRRETERERDADERERGERREGDRERQRGEERERERERDDDEREEGERERDRDADRERDEDRDEEQRREQERDQSDVERDEDEQE